MSRVKRMPIAVIGAGTMGRGIALTALLHGYDVAIFDTDRAAAQRFSDGARDTASDAAGGAGSGPSVTVAESIAAAVAQADAVIESIVESDTEKISVLREIVSAAAPDALLATNTSTFSIARLATGSGCEGRLIGMHFFNPAQKMRLVEVAVADGTPDEYVRRCVGLAESLGKTSVVVRDSPGFVTSRLGLALGNEAMRLVATGVAPPIAIDTAMRLGYNHPMGPLELADLVGLDARLNNLNALYPALGDDRYRPPQILIDLVQAGHLGRKSGRGFYRYDPDGRRIDGPPSAPTAPGGQQ
jgi:3-hydroxybutyryl-CoA dehydrogenase